MVFEFGVGHEAPLAGGLALSEHVFPLQFSVFDSGWSQGRHTGIECTLLHHARVPRAGTICMAPQPEGRSPQFPRAVPLEEVEQGLRTWSDAPGIDPVPLDEGRDVRLGVAHHAGDVAECEPHFAEFPDPDESSVQDHHGGASCTLFLLSGFGGRRIQSLTGSCCKQWPCVSPGGGQPSNHSDSSFDRGRVHV